MIIKVIEPAPVPESLRPCLVLNVTKKYYDLIKSGLKTIEYREKKQYWKSRLEGKSFNAVVISNRRGTRFSDPEWLIFPWNGYQETTIMPVSFGTSDIFGTAPIPVYAILLNQEPCRDNPALSQ